MTASAIRDQFKAYFSPQGFTLPDPLPENGEIEERGWTIRYNSGLDETGQPWLEFFAVHRMTNPRHVRIYADGSQKIMD